MTGFIREREVAHHPVLVAREFGWRVLIRCLWAAMTRRRITFLELALTQPS